MKYDASGTPPPVRRHRFIWSVKDIQALLQAEAMRAHPELSGHVGKWTVLMDRPMEYGGLDARQIFLEITERLP